MALSKNKTTAFGVTGSYWRVIEVRMNVDEQSSCVMVGQYVDAEHRASGAAPMQLCYYNFSGAAFPYDPSAFAGGACILSLTYDALKTLPDFAGAVNV